MAVSLSKGGNVSLTKEAGPAGLTDVVVGLGWDARTTTGTEFDLDGSAIAVDANGKVILNLMQQDTKALRVVMRVGYQVAVPLTRLGGKYPAGVVTPAA